MDELLIKNMKRKLIELAKNNDPMGYQKFSDEFQLGYDMHYDEDRKLIGEVLGEISESEHSEGLPLLSVFIQHENTKLPGNGFFKMAERLGRFMPNFMDRTQFVKRERADAYNYWNKHKV